jgi:hypothetical protein
MKSAKAKKPAKTKSSNMRMKDLRPKKDARGGSQNKEGPEENIPRLTV